MEVRNPTFNAPVLAPTSNFSHSRSPSHSPTRSHSPRRFDPLLRDLSPSSTLRAFAPPSTYQPTRRTSPRRAPLETSFSKVSNAQRELGTKAAQACLDIRGWTRELESWDWPGCFEEPEPARKKARTSIMSIGSLASGWTAGTTEGEVDTDDKAEFWGSLPSQTVLAYERRLHAISAELEGVDLDELKSFVLSAHRSETSEDEEDGTVAKVSKRDTSTSTDLKKLDDFTAVVTATILQTLPYLNRLARLLESWTVRLTILQQIPSFLDDLERLRTDLNHGWAAVAVSLRKNGAHAMLGASDMHEMQRLIESRMSSLGRRLDGFLDLLEGRDECVPDTFLDKFEELEERYAEWVVMAQRRVLGDKLKQFEFDLPKTSPELKSETQETKTQAPRVGKADSTAWYESEHDQTKWYDTEDDADLVRETGKSMSLRKPEQPAAAPLPSDPAQPMSPQSRDNGVTTGEWLFPSPPQRSTSKEKTPNRGSVHLPIVLDFGFDSSESDPSPRASNTQIKQMALPESVPDMANGHAKAGAEAEHGNLPSSSMEVERQSSLQKQTKSPVRPFEHATNAFTRLFKREKSPERGRHRPLKSETNIGFLKGRRSGSSKRDSKSRDSTIVWGGRQSVTAAQSDKLPIAELEASYPPQGRKSEQIEHADVVAKPIAIPDAPRASVEIKGVQNEGGNGSTIQLPVLEDVPKRERSRSVAVKAAEDPSKPQTYQPRRASPILAPPTEHDVPENWPLVSPPQGTTPAETSPERSASEGESTVESREKTDSSEDASAPRPNLTTVRSMNALGSDDFQRVFIDGLSVNNQPLLFVPPPEDEAEVKSWDDAEGIPTPQNEDSILSSTSTSSQMNDEPIVVSTMLGSDGRQDNLSVARAISIEALNHPDFGRAQNQKERYTDFLRDERASSLPSGIDDIEPEEKFMTPEEQMEVQNASLAYFPIKSSPTHNRSAIHDEKADPESSSGLETGALKVIVPHSRADSAVPQSEELGNQTAEAGEQIKDYSSSDDFASRPVKPRERDPFKRASTASIKAHSRAEVRSIDLSSHKLSMEDGNLPRQLSTKLQAASNETTPRPSVESARFITPTDLRRSVVEQRSRSPASPTGEKVANFSRLRGDSVGSSSARNSQSGELNDAMVKKRRREVMALEPIPAVSEAPPDIRRTPKTVQAPATSSKQKVLDGDVFDRHVSQVLERIPARIKFKSRAGAETPLPGSQSTTSQRTAEPRNYVGPRPKPRIGSRGSLGPGALTIAPAESSAKKATPTDPEVKLYHLTQAGRDEPIKLFVRLVGDGERVMVRVGGGWADLADYLRQYAEHHGSRTVSESGVGLELQTAGSTPTGSRNVSGAVKFRPGSRDGEATRSGRKGAATPSDGAASPISPTASVFATPQSRSSRPSTANGPPESSSRPSSSTGASPRTNGEAGDQQLRKEGSKAALAEHKAKWVEGMLERAKKETAAAREGKSDTYGEIGKVGATRRVAFRQSSLTPGTPSKEEIDHESEKVRF